MSVPATPVNASATLLNRATNDSVPIAAAMSEFQVFNRNSNTAIATNPKDPYRILLDVEANGSNSVLVPVPEGATYAQLFHEYAGTTIPSTRPKVRVFGMINPSRGDGERAVTPSAISASFYDPYANPKAVTSSPLSAAHAASRQWIPLSNISTAETVFEIGDATNDPAMTMNAVSSRSSPKLVHTLGCRYILVVVVTAAVGPSAGCIAGHFGQ